MDKRLLSDEPFTKPSAIERLRKKIKNYSAQKGKLKGFIKLIGVLIAIGIIIAIKKLMRKDK